MPASWRIGIDDRRWILAAPGPIIACDPLRWHSTRKAGGTLASCAQKYPFLVRPRPGLSTGSRVSSAKIRGEASTICFSWAANGASSAAAVPTQDASVERSIMTPWRVQICAWR